MQLFLLFPGELPPIKTAAPEKWEELPETKTGTRMNR
jgi:hypothetical protein